MSHPRRTPLATALLLAASLAPLATAGKLRVPKDHPTAQAAVDAAQPGDTIVLGPGTHGPIVIEGRYQLVLRGEKGAVVVSGNSAALRVKDSQAITVRDLAFGKSFTGILATSSDALTVKDCRFDLPGTSMFDGVYAEDCDGLTVVGCRFTKFENVGIYARDGIGARIEDCEVIGGSHGVVLGSVAGVARRCRIRDGSLYSYYASGTNNLLASSDVRGDLALVGEAHVVRENRIRNGGIYVTGERHRVFGNRLKKGLVGDMPQASILLVDADACVVARNRLEKPGVIGVFVDDRCTELTLLENRVKKSAAAAFRLEGIGNVLMRNVAKHCPVDVQDTTDANVYAGNSFPEPQP